MDSINLIKESNYLYIYIMYVLPPNLSTCEPTVSVSLTSHYEKRHTQRPLGPTQPPRPVPARLSAPGKKTTSQLLPSHEACVLLTRPLVNVVTRAGSTGTQARTMPGDHGLSWASSVSLILARWPWAQPVISSQRLPPQSAFGAVADCIAEGSSKASSQLILL